MKKLNLKVSICLVMCLALLRVTAQQILPTPISVNPPKVVNFQELAAWEKANPPKKTRRFIEQGEDKEKNFKFKGFPVPPDAKTFRVPEAQQNGQRAAQLNSPAVLTEFSGVLDNGTLIPPDIRGAAGSTYVLETTNQQFNIYTKSGSLASTLTITTFFNSTGGSGYYDPHVAYDVSYGRYVICMDGVYSNGDGGLFVAVSQTSDPTGSWYVYSFDALGNKTDFLDYPLMGFNTNWVVVTGNDFIGGSSPVYANLYVMSRASLYSGTLGTVSKFQNKNTNAFSIDPAQTFDVTQTTEYLVMDYNGNSSGNGFVQIGTITGTPTAPVYTVGSTIGVNQTWSETSTAAKQLGSTHTLEEGDTRIGNSVYINGSLWFTHTVFLPASSPTYSGVDWWQINPSALTLTQFGRLATSGTFYYYPNIAVNTNGDALLGYSVSSSSQYSSAGYAFHAAADPVNTMESGVIFKAGVAGYYKTYGGGRNRWGDFSGGAVDPSDNSFWVFGEWANTSNNWGTAVAHVPASSGTVTCNAPTGMSTSAITTTSATFSWTAASGANSYNVQYRIVGTSTWSTGTASTNSFNATSLTAGSNYEWQVATVCSSGTSSFTASTDFSTNSANTCNAPTGMSTSGVSSTGATFSWSTATGANSYNLQYRIVGTSTWTSATASGTTYSAASLTPASNYEWQVQTVCASGSSAFTASTDFTTSAACGAVSGLAAGSITSSSAALSWAAVSGALSYNLQWQAAGGTVTTVTGLTSATYNLSGLNACTAYSFSVQSVCSAGPGAYSSATSFSTIGCVTNYCASTATDQTFEYIKKVVLGSISQTSTDAQGGYIDYTAVSTNLPVGSNTITLTPGFTSGAYTEAFTVYIDYNHNGVFTNTGETVVEVKGSAAVSKAFTVPATAVNGATRMRIQMQYSAYETNSCATYQYGSVQDFTVNITGGAASPALDGDVVASPDATDNSDENIVQTDAIDMVKLYPNPAHDNITIEFNAIQQGNGKVSVYNLAGQKVLASETGVTTGLNRLNIITRTLTDGVYIVEIESNGCLKRERFIVTQ